MCGGQNGCVGVMTGFVSEYNQCLGILPDLEQRVPLKNKVFGTSLCLAL